MKAPARSPRRVVFRGIACTAALFVLLAALPVSCGLPTSGLPGRPTSSSAAHTSSGSGQGGDLFTSSTSASSGMGGASSSGSSSSGGGGAGGGTGGGPLAVWHSWEVQSAAPPNPEMFVLDTMGQNKALIIPFQSVATNDLNVDIALSTYVPTPYLDATHEAGSYWVPSAGATDPYVSKNLVPRGTELTEMGNAPPPLNVLDLQLYPSQASPDKGKLIVAAFEVPIDGDYTVLDLAARRLLPGPGDHATFKVFVDNTLIKALPQANMNQKWVKDTNSYPLGMLTTGTLINFAVDCGGDAERDVTEISWTVTAN